MGNIDVTAVFQQLHSVAMTVEIMMRQQPHVPSFASLLYLLCFIRLHVKTLPDVAVRTAALKMILLI